MECTLGILAANFWRHSSPAIHQYTLQFWEPNAGIAQLNWVELHQLATPLALKRGVPVRRTPARD